MEHIWAGLLLVAIAFLVMIALGSGWPRRKRSPAPGDDLFDRDDLAELSASLAVIAAEHNRGREALTAAALRTRLGPVISRRSPVRTISSAPIRGATRICFADGTRVLVRSQEGRLARLAYEASRYPVCLRSCRLGPDGPELTFDCYGGQVTALVVGFDQAD